MVKAFIKLRFRQLLRTIGEIGILRMIVVTIIVTALAIAIFHLSTERKESFYLIMAQLFIVFIIQIKRADKVFLKTSFEYYRRILLSEYFLLSSFIFFSLFLHFQLLAVIILGCGLYLVSFIDFRIRQNTLNTKLQKMIPAKCFEWKAGIRRSLFFLLPVWIIGLCASFFVGSVPIVLFLLGIATAQFYEECEPYQLVTIFEKKADHFLWYKITQQIKLFSLITLPLIAVFMIFHHEVWYIPVCEYILFILIHAYLIMMKYAFYVPASKPQSIQTFGAIGIAGALIPVLLPALLLLGIYFYFKSRKTLQHYLYDFN